MCYCNAELCVSDQILAEILTLEKIPIPNLLLLIATERTHPVSTVLFLPVILFSSSLSVFPRKVSLESAPVCAGSRQKGDMFFLSSVFSVGNDISLGYHPCFVNLKYCLKIQAHRLRWLPKWEFCFCILEYRDRPMLSGEFLVWITCLGWDSKWYQYLCP